MLLKGERPTFLHDLLPQGVDQDGVRVTSTVDDGQLAFRQPEVVRKLPIQLDTRAEVRGQSLTTLGPPLPPEHTTG